MDAPILQIRTAIILAAGRGLRLGHIGKRIPKGLLQLGRYSILEQSLNCLIDNGIEKIIIVTGHLREQLAPLIDRFRRQAVEIVNPDYATQGNMRSLACALGSLEEERFLLLESDLVYERRAIAQLMGSTWENALLVSTLNNSGDEVYVASEQGFLRGLSKNRAELIGPVVGQYIGIAKMTRTLLQQMVEFQTSFAQEHLKLEYDLGCLNAIWPNHPIACEILEDLIWSEIDDEQQWQIARDQVFPRILERSALDGTAKFR